MYRVRTAITNFGGGPFLSTMFFDTTGGTAQQAANAVRAYWLNFLTHLTTGVVVTVEPAVYTLDPATGQATAVDNTTTATVTGTSSGDPLPSTTQLLQRWNTGIFLSGRLVRGRTFIPTLTELVNTNTRPTAAILTAADTAGGNLIADANSVFVVWHRPTPAAPSSGSMVVVNGASSWTEWAVLRSRRD